jgi:hypothetical protein
MTPMHNTPNKLDFFIVIFRQFRPDVIIILESRVNYSGSSGAKILWKIHIKGGYGSITMVRVGHASITDVSVFPYRYERPYVE